MNINPIHNSQILMKMYGVYSLPKKDVWAGKIVKVNRECVLIQYKTQITKYEVDSIDSTSENDWIHVRFYSKDGIKVEEAQRISEYGITWLLIRKENLQYIDIQYES